MLIALIVSSDLVAPVSRYPWQDHKMSWRQRGGGVGRDTEQEIVRNREKEDALCVTVMTSKMLK